MVDKIKVPVPGGGHVDATSIDVNQSSEQWNTYLLDDGSTLRAKLVVTKVFRIDNSYDVEGNPVYSFHSQNICTVQAPENLRKKNQ